MKLLVAIDFSDATDVVLQESQKLAGALDGAIYLVHVVPPEPDFIGYDPGPQTERKFIASLRHQEHREIQELGQELEKKGFDVTALLVQGSTVETILEQARKLPADMIVLGSHGHGAVYHLLAGSVSKGVLKQATCPVLVVPIREKAGTDA